MSNTYPFVESISVNTSANAQKYIDGKWFKEIPDDPEEIPSYEELLQMAKHNGALLDQAAKRMRDNAKDFAKHCKESKEAHAKHMQEMKSIGVALEEEKAAFDETMRLTNITITAVAVCAAYVNENSNGGSCLRRRRTGAGQGHVHGRE